MLKCTHRSWTLQFLVLITIYIFKVNSFPLETSGTDGGDNGKSASTANDDTFEKMDLPDDTPKDTKSVIAQYLFSLVQQDKRKSTTLIPSVEGTTAESYDELDYPDPSTVEPLTVRTTTPSTANPTRRLRKRSTSTTEEIYYEEEDDTTTEPLTLKTSTTTTAPVVISTRRIRTRPTTTTTEDPYYEEEEIVEKKDSKPSKAEATDAIKDIINAAIFQAQEETKTTTTTTTTQPTTTMMRRRRTRSTTPTVPTTSTTELPEYYDEETEATTTRRRTYRPARRTTRNPDSGVTGWVPEEDDDYHDVTTVTPASSNTASVLKDITKLLVNVGTANVSGIVDQSLKIASVDTVSNVISGVFNLFTCTPIEQLVGRCKQQRDGGKSKTQEHLN